MRAVIAVIFSIVIIILYILGGVPTPLEFRHFIQDANLMEKRSDKKRDPNIKILTDWSHYHSVKFGDLRLHAIGIGNGGDIWMFSESYFKKSWRRLPGLKGDAVDVKILSSKSGYEFIYAATREGEIFVAGIDKPPKAGFMGGRNGAAPPKDLNFNLMKSWLKIGEVDLVVDNDEVKWIEVVKIDGEYVFTLLSKKGDFHVVSMEGADIKKVEGLNIKAIKSTVETHLKHYYDAGFYLISSSGKAFDLDKKEISTWTEFKLPPLIKVSADRYNLILIEDVNKREYSILTKDGLEAVSPSFLCGNMQLLGRYTKTHRGGIFNETSVHVGKEQKIHYQTIKSKFKMKTGLKNIIEEKACIH